MILNASQIEQNVAWLIQNASPPVRYLTHKHLLKASIPSEVMDALWQEVETCQDAVEIFSKQQEDGSWCSGGSWADSPPYSLKNRPGGYDPESPKYVTTIWVLPLLGDMGFTIRDQRVRQACEYILSYKCAGMENEYRIFNEPDFRPDHDTFTPCRFARWLVALSKVGMQNDVRVRRGYAFLSDSQMDDGGWVNPFHSRMRHWTRSCPASSGGAALAFYASGLPQYQNVLLESLKFQAWHLSTKEIPEIQRFFYHGHNTIQELLMFSEHRVGLEMESVQAQLEWLMTMYRPDDAHFHYTGKPISKYTRREDDMDPRVARYWLYHCREDDWLTYYATRIAVNLHAQTSAVA